MKIIRNNWNEEITKKTGYKFKKHEKIGNDCVTKIINEWK